MTTIRAPNADEVNARHIEEQLCEAVAQEIAGGVRREGLWLKAIAEALGDDGRAKAIYIRLRAQSMLDEAVREQTRARRR